MQRLLRETSICDRIQRAPRWRLVYCHSLYLLSLARKLWEAQFRCGLTARPPFATEARVLPGGGLAATIHRNRLEAGVVTYTTTHTCINKHTTCAYLCPSRCRMRILPFRFMWTYVACVELTSRAVSLPPSLPPSLDRLPCLLFKSVLFGVMTGATKAEGIRPSFFRLPSSRPPRSCPVSTHPWGFPQQRGNSDMSRRWNVA